MNSARNFDVSTLIKHNPQAEDAGALRIYVNIIVGGDIFPFTTTSFIEEFIDLENYNCQSKHDLNCFLMDVQLNDDVICDAMIILIEVVDHVTFDVRRSEGLQRITLEVRLDVHVLPHEPHDSQIEEAVQASLNHTNNIWFRPASKLLVESLPRKIYNKTNLDDDKCTICLEEFNNGTSTVVTLPCGHDQFDDECISKWFETSLVCPLCRFELPCED